MEDGKEKALLEAQLKRIITRLFKDFLVIADDIRQDHLATLADMKGFPEEVKLRWNYLDLGKYSRIRKRVLDQGNDAVREMQTVLDSFGISLDNRDKE